MRKQYLQLKKQYPDAILFFRLGDFYETFDDDAKTVSEVCEITLTSRPIAKGVRVPLAGVPHHAAETYIARLVKAGYKVAIAEQADSGNRNLMARKVVRLVTPGTITEETLLSPRSNNYLLGLVVNQGAAGVAYVDVSTGEFVAEEHQYVDTIRLIDILAGLQPAECVITDGDTEAAAIARELAIPTAHIEAWKVMLPRAPEVLLEHFAVTTLAPFGIEDRPHVQQAAALCLVYLQETQPNASDAVKSLRFNAGGESMHLDRAVQRTLEIVRPARGELTQSTLLSVLDDTLTAMGARLLRARLIKPLLRIDAIEHRLEGVQSLFDSDTLRSQVRECLRRMPDLERLSARVAQGTANPRHLRAIASALAGVSALKEVLAANVTSLAGEAREAFGSLDACPEIKHLIEQAIAEDAPVTLNTPGVIRPGFNADLDAIVGLASNAHQVLAELEAKERRRSGIKNLRIGHNKVFGYYIEVPRSLSEKVPSNYVRKQTLSNSERFFTEELKSIEARILSAQERRLALERELWAQVVTEVAAYSDTLLNVARAVAILDVLSALAEVARRHAYVRPEVSDSERIDIVGGRHPVVEAGLRREGIGFVPNDVHMSNSGETILIITGPNMAGKSTYLRQVALIVLMAQVGSYVPAEEAHVGVVDRIFTRIGAQDEIAAGRSTFMIEMIETASILRQATPRSLVILDEVGRGTSTYDGMAIARALIEYIHDSPRLGCKTLFATHYHELVDLERYLPRVRNYNVAVAEEENDVVFLHKIVPGGADRSYGIHVARLAGVPQPVLERASQILTTLEAQGQQPLGPPPVTPAATQLALFSSASAELIQELSETELDTLTPIAALNLLSEFRERAAALLQSRSKRRVKP